MGDEEQEEYIYYYAKKSKSDKNQGKSQDFQDRQNERIHNAENRSRNEKILPISPKNKTRNKPFGY